MSSKFLTEAQRLYDMGLAPHWIKPNSKAPVKAGWSGTVRDTMDDLLLTYEEGMGLGVRLGEPSKIDDFLGGYLANIDVDIKSSDPRHRQEALAALKQHFPNPLMKAAPVVQTGYGLRFFIRTLEPVKSGKITASSETCRVLMPNSEISARQRKELNAEELKAGWRIRTAWELELMSTGRQVVLPPSIHPDTGREYIWQKPLVDSLDIPCIRMTGGTHLEPVKALTVSGGFIPVPYDLEKLPQHIKDMILEGTGVEDRSAALLSVCIQMFRAGFTEQQILTVLTDKCFLGEVAYEHAGRTRDRAKAARWLERYTMPKARLEADPANVFDAVAEIEDVPLLESAELVTAQTLELVGEPRLFLKRGGQNGEGAVQKSLENTVAALEFVVGKEVFKRDMFAARDFYGMDTPWGGVNGETLTDDDAVKISHWLGKNYHFEPPLGVVFGAMILIAERNRFHPVREELLTLELWDGIPRLDTWLRDNFEARGPDEYLAQVFRKWMVASVKRVFEPGAKFDWMPIFQGAQGVGKSAFGRLLFGENYFTDWLPVLSDKDAALGLRGVRCVEFGELAALRKNELEITKAFITRQKDKVRPPYGRLSIEIFRQCVFFGTTNLETYLKDDSGNRRFNPVEVGWLNFEVLKCDRDQLWAEAMFLYQNGFEPVLDLQGEALQASKEIQAEKMVEDESAFMAERLKWFFKEEVKKPEKERFPLTKFKLLDLWEGMGPLQKWLENGRNIQFASKALKSIGGVKWKSDGRMFWKMI